MQKISFAELSAQPQIDGRVPIICDVQPPTGVDAEQAYLNASTLRFLSRCAGFSELHLGFDTNEQSATSVAGAAIDGVNADGSAVGRATTTRRKESAFGVRSEDPDGRPREFWRPEIYIDIERAPFGSNVADRTRRGMPLDKAWTRELDHQIRRGMAFAALEALLFDAVPGLPVSMIEMLIAAVSDLQTTAEILLTTQLGISLFHAQTSNKKDFEPRDFKFNIFGTHGFQPDRVILAGLATALLPAVAPTIGLHRQKSKDE